MCEQERVCVCAVGVGGGGGHVCSYERCLCAVGACGGDSGRGVRAAVGEDTHAVMTGWGRDNNSVCIPISLSLPVCVCVHVHVRGTMCLGA